MAQIYRCRAGWPAEFRKFLGKHPAVSHNCVFIKIPSPAPRAWPKSACTLHKRRILVVDDEECLTKLVALLLEQNNTYIVRVENNAAKAVSAAVEFHPDLILMDITMPSLDGGELASRMRANPVLQSVPIVFLTGSVTEEEVAENDGYIGGQRFLAKPFHADDLLGCVDQELAE
jgi:CheY-like chemotaxis protein